MQRYGIQKEIFSNENFDKIKLFLEKTDVKKIMLWGGEPLMSTFWQDFSIADKFGDKAIADTYRRAKSEWKDNYKYWTELCLVLNHKIWQWHERDNQRAILYDKLWREADEMTSEWSDEKQEYYFQVTD